MNEYTRIEIAVGFFVTLGMAGLAYLSISIGGASFFRTDRYTVHARFASVGDLSPGAVVKLAGVPVGEVRRIQIDQYAAGVEMRVDESLELPADTIASIKTAGLLGEAYVSLSPGASLDNIADGGRISQTEPPLDIFELVEKYAFGEGVEGGSSASSSGEAGGETSGDDAGAAEEKPSPFPDPLE
ncbi:MAG: outer membrane lipid asymmetry maintenance protein MlaD [Myxococcales bacterium]|jgi:phospholipid/cholesterol/gamma-HCH transport system substrate-binding protein